MRFWDRHILPRLITFACGQGQVMKRRALVVPGATGRVLEYGCGGGLNLQFYQPDAVTSLTGIDPHAELLARTDTASACSAIPIETHRGIAEDLPFADASFDTVVTTFTLCSVQDPEAALSEARRVLAPGGRLLFLEHGRSPDADVLQTQQRIEPLWRRMAGNCHLTRPVSASIEAAGFRITRSGQGYTPKSPKFAGWMEWGSAEPIPAPR